MSTDNHPVNLYSPRIYRTFTPKKNDNLNFRIEDLNEKYFDEAIGLFVEHFMPEETFSVAKKLHLDDEVRTITTEFFREILNKNLSVGCFMEGSPQLVAVNFMDVKSKHDELPEVRKIQ